VVAHSRTALGTRHVRSLIKTSEVLIKRQKSDLRPLNAPSPVRVQTDAQGRIVSLWRQGRLTPRSIAAIQDHWRIDDEWWREHTISRIYFELLLDDGTLLTVYHDLVADAWFEQRS
jgi:hypothetical protein